MTADDARREARLRRVAARQGDLDTDMADKLADAAIAAGLDDGEIESTIYSAACAEEVDIEASPSAHQPPGIPGRRAIQW